MPHAAQREGAMKLLAVIYLAVVWGVCAFTLLLATGAASGQPRPGQSVNSWMQEQQRRQDESSRRLQDLRLEQIQRDQVNELRQFRQQQDDYFQQQQRRRQTEEDER